LIIRAKTSSKAVGEQIDKARGRDNVGPLDVALAVEDKGGAKPSKIIVAGNSTFMSDTILKQFGFDGLYFMMNSLSWMQDKKDDVVSPRLCHDVTCLYCDGVSLSEIHNRQEERTIYDNSREELRKIGNRVDG